MSGHQRRYREITRVLSRHGLGYLVGAFGLDRWVPLQRGPTGDAFRTGTHHTRAEHIRLALEELGATFVKLGQVLSTRPDLLPPDLQLELAKLQDSAKPVSADAVLDLLDRGGFDVSLRATELEPLVARVERIGNRLVAGVVVAAFIEGLAELAAADPQRWRAHEPKLVTAGFGIAAGRTGYLAWTARGLGRRPPRR